MAASQEADHDPQTGPPRLSSDGCWRYPRPALLGPVGLRLTPHTDRAPRRSRRWRRRCYPAAARHRPPADDTRRRRDDFRAEFKRHTDDRAGRTDRGADNGGRRLPGRRAWRGRRPGRDDPARHRRLGGIERFVKPGNDVIVKPNICKAYHGPEYATTTNPDVVAALVALCLEAGAKRVRVMDFPFGGSAQASYETSGIAAAVKAAGGDRWKP